MGFNPFGWNAGTGPTGSPVNGPQQRRNSWLLWQNIPVIEMDPIGYVREKEINAVIFPAQASAPGNPPE